MKIAKNRHMMILHTLINTEGPVTAATLAHLSRASLRSIKNDVVELNDSLRKQDGVEIVSLKAKGYQLKVLDENAFQELSTYVNALYAMFHNRSIETVNRRLYILQRLMVDEYVKIDELAEELYLSRSSLSKDFSWAVSFLESYHLKVLPELGKGYHVSGLEQDLRAAMVELRCSQYHEFKPLYPYQAFDDLFKYEGINHYQELRQAFLSVLRGSRITVSDIAAKKISSHLCLMKNRILEGKSVYIEEEIAEEIRNTYDYEIARQIFDDETIKAYVQPEEIEIINLARLLLINRDIDLRRNGIEDLPIRLVHENLLLFNEIIAELKGAVIGTKIHDTDFFKIYSRDFESLQMQLFLRHRYDHTSKIRFITYLEGEEDLLSPVPLEMARVMIHHLQERFKEPIRDAIVMSYAALYERLFKKITYAYHKYRLAVTSTHGLVYSQNLSENLQELFGPYIEKIDVFNLYEMRKIDFSDYDALLHAGPLEYYAYPLKLVHLRELDYQDRNWRMFNELFRYGYDRQRLEEIKKITHVYDGSNIDDLPHFIEALSYRYGADHIKQKTIVEKYAYFSNIIDHYYSRHGMIVFLVPYELTGREFIDLYLPAHSLYHEQSVEIKAVILACFNDDLTLSELKVSDHILRYIIQVSNVLPRLIENKNDTLDMIFDKVVERSFTKQN